MKRATVLTALIALLCALDPCAVPADAGRIEFGRLGTVFLYGSASRASNVVLFVSGDGGWNKEVVDMARALASRGMFVAGIDIRRYLASLARSAEPCLYPAADFEALSKFIQKKLGFPSYRQPVLAGYSSGASLVYGVLAQAPPNTFRGAISLGFCPSLPIAKPLCTGSGLANAQMPTGRQVRLFPRESLEEPWIVLQGTIDKVCNAAAAAEFVKNVPSAGIVLLPRVGHGFGVQKRWLPQFEAAFTGIAREDGPTAAGRKGTLGDLPLIELPAREPAKDLLAIILSGDGGWAGLDREVGRVLAQKGIAVVGLDSLRYFWTPRTPERLAADLGRIMRHYLAAWGKSNVVLIGYSFGAEVLPFAMNRIPRDLLGHVRLAALLAPGREADFEFHLADWLGGGSRKTSRPLLPEVEKLKNERVLCFYGEDERESLCRELLPGIGERIPLKGGHHFGGRYASIAEMILDRIR